MKLRSRINEVFTPEFLDELFDLFKQYKFYVTGKDGKKERVQDVRHFKALTFRKKLADYFENTDISFSFLGDGTNRMAFLVDGYVFKLALDDQGYIDNLTEFKMSKEAQPFVTKTYETNGLFCVAEYVTLISYDEFVKQKSRILEILETLSSEYLLGDMGWTKKNYCNWGYRKNTKDLVILDYGHMLPIDHNKMICSECGGFLHYNSTFTKIQCISCGKEHDFINMKQKISKREEIEMLDNYLNESVKTTEKSVEIKDEVKKPKKVNIEEEEDEIVSTRFVEFYPKKKKRRLSDFFDDPENNWDDEEPEEDNLYESEDWFNAAQAIINAQEKVKERKKEEKQEQKKYNSVDEYRIAQLLEEENWLFYLGGMVASDEITDQQFFQYKKIIEETLVKRNGEEKEELSTIGEIIKVKEEKPQRKVEEKQESQEEDSYMAMLKMLGGCDYEEEIKEESKVKEEVTPEEAEIMEEFLDMDDDIEGGMRVEDFMAKNSESLGFDEEDEPDEESDKILARIKRVTNEQLKAMENEFFDEDDEDEDVPSFEVIEPEVEETKVIKEESPSLEIIEPEVEKEITVMKADELNKNLTIYPADVIKEKMSNNEEKTEPIGNIFKVQRKVENVGLKVDGEDVNESSNTKNVETVDLKNYDEAVPENDIAKMYQKAFEDSDPKVVVKEPEIENKEEVEKIPNQKSIINAIAKAHQQTQELEKDYDHYEEDYGYLYDEEDPMKNKGNKGKGWN